LFADPLKSQPAGTDNAPVTVAPLKFSEMETAAVAGSAQANRPAAERALSNPGIKETVVLIVENRPGIFSVW
jgi:hypothetical protein